MPLRMHAGMHGTKSILQPRTLVSYSVQRQPLRMVPQWARKAAQTISDDGLHAAQVPRQAGPTAHHCRCASTAVGTAKLSVCEACTRNALWCLLAFGHN